MLKQKALCLLLLLQLFFGCGEKGPFIDLPAPTPKEQDDDNEEVSHKIVTPEGRLNWTTTKIDDGIVYYAFSGKDSVSNVIQEVFVVDIDLNNKNYITKLVYTNPRQTTSDAFKLESGTVCAMNANYEPASIFCRVNGYTIYNMQNDVIGSTTVPNWKNDGYFTSDRNQNVSISYFGSNVRGEKTLAQQRSYYAGLSIMTCPDLITSAPMLIDDYKPVGETFVTAASSFDTANKSNSEHPYTHQNNRHPRSAIAMTGHNHLLLLVVDGRTTYSSGMSAKELTKFFVRYFNPRYALNMDGGGSSSIVVKGQGDPITHVVNYPCNDKENHYHDHYGERTRDIHFVVVKK